MKDLFKKRMNLKLFVIVTLSLVTISALSIWYAQARASESATASSSMLSSQLITFNSVVSDDKQAQAEKISSLLSFSSGVRQIKASLCYQDVKGLISSFIQKTSKCIKKQTTLDHILEYSNQLLEIVKTDEYMTNSLTHAPDIATIHEQANFWADVAKEYSQYEVSDYIMDDKQKIVDAINDYSRVWTVLDNADIAHDEVAFKAAREAVFASYTKLVKNKEVFKGLISKKTLLLNQQIQLFKS